MKVERKLMYRKRQVKLNKKKRSLTETVMLIFTLQTEMANWPMELVSIYM